MKTEKQRITRLFLLTKLQEENILNIKSIEDQVEFRKEIPNTIDNFIALLETKSLAKNSTLTRNLLGEILQSSAYTFIQSNLVNYINTHNTENSDLSKELATLEFYQNDLELSSTKGLDLKIKYVFESLENDVDFNKLTILSYDTLQTLSFKNKMVLLSEIEYEISTMYAQTYQQMKKVDSLITTRLSK